MWQEMMSVKPREESKMVSIPGRKELWHLEGMWVIAVYAGLHTI